MLALCQTKWWRATTWNVSFEILYGGQFTLSNYLIKPNYLIILLTNAAAQFLWKITFQKEPCHKIWSYLVLFYNWFIYQHMFIVIGRTQELWVGRFVELIEVQLLLGFVNFPFAVIFAWFILISVNHAVYMHQHKLPSFLCSLKVIKTDLPYSVSYK